MFMITVLLRRNNKYIGAKTLQLVSQCSIAIRNGSQTTCRL